MDPKPEAAEGDQTTTQPPIGGDQADASFAGGDQAASSADQVDDEQTEHRDVAEGRAPALPLASAVGIEAACIAAGIDVPPAVKEALAADPLATEAARQAHDDLVKAAKAAKPKKTKKPATAGKAKE